MDAYEKIIKTMREEAGKEAGDMLPSFGLAEMTGEKTLSFNGLDFDEEDVLFADYLLNRAIKKVDFTIGDDTPSENEGHHVHPWTDKSKYMSKLAAGDTVFGFIIDDDDDEKFLVLCRVGGA